MKSALLYAATSTPFGRFGGALAVGRPYDLAATALAGFLKRTPVLGPSLIADVFRGKANGAGEDDRNVGRMAVLLAGLPTSVTATTVNRLCGARVIGTLARRLQVAGEGWGVAGICIGVGQAGAVPLENTGTRR